MAAILVVNIAAGLYELSLDKDVEPGDLGATTSHGRFIIRAVLVGPKICIISCSIGDNVAVLVVVPLTNFVPQEYPNNLLKASSTTILVGDDDIGDVGGALRFADKGIAATAAVVTPSLDF